MDSRLRASLTRLGGRDPYAVLGLADHATQQEINRAYRRLAAKWHPDRWPPEQHSAAEIASAKQTFAHVQAAAGILRDQQSRTSYSEWVAAQSSTPPSTPAADAWDQAGTAPASGPEHDPAAAAPAGGDDADPWDSGTAPDIAAMGGLVPFRPLTLREQLGAALRLLAARPAFVFGLSGAVALLSAGFQLWAQLGFSFGDLAFAPYLTIAVAVAAALPGIALGLSVLVVFTGDMIVWGSRLTQLVSRASGRVPCVLGLSGGVALSIAACILTAHLASFWLLLPAIAICILYSLAVPVAVLETVSIDEAFGRAGVLVRYSPGRMVTIALINLGIAALATGAAAIPFLIAGGGAILDPAATLTTTQALLRSGWIALAGTFVLAWFPVTGTLLYVDQLIRQEAMADELAQVVQREG